MNWLLILSFILGALLLWWTRNWYHWKSRGIEGPQPLPLFGNVLGVLIKPASVVFKDVSRKYGKIAGFFIGCQPRLLVTDPILIRDMLIKDFHYFTDRSDVTDLDFFMKNSISHMRGDKWKETSTIMKSTFSSAKMRKLHPIINDCVNRLDSFMDKVSKDECDIDMKRMVDLFVMDVTARAVFNTKLDVYDHDKFSQFIRQAKKAIYTNWRVLFFHSIAREVPGFFKFFGYRLTEPVSFKYFESLTRSNINERGKLYCNDYLQYLINARNNVQLDDCNDDQDHKTLKLFSHDKDDISNDTDEHVQSKIVVSDDDIVANTYLFFNTGYKPVVSLLSYLMYSLALDGDCQDQLYDEIKQLNGEFSYDNLTKMPYMDACIAETLRLYTPFPCIIRSAAADYKIYDKSVIIPKGTLVYINIEAVHHDPDYYPEPERWLPERFMPDSKHKLHPHTYMPFGVGPRNCVALRFALMETKTMVAQLINKYRFYRSPQTKVPLKPKRFDFILDPGEIILGFQKRT